jgi:hypothetical protein
MATSGRDMLRIGWGGVLAFAGKARAADEYPNKPIKLIVAAAPGGPTDLPARIASQILAPNFGQPVVGEPSRSRWRARRASCRGLAA